MPNTTPVTTAIAVATLAIVPRSTIRILSPGSQRVGSARPAYQPPSRADRRRPRLQTRPLLATVANAGGRGRPTFGDFGRVSALLLCFSWADRRNVAAAPPRFTASSA